MSGQDPVDDPRSAPMSRRAFLTRMTAVAFAAPVISSFAMESVAQAASTDQHMGNQGRPEDQHMGNQGGHDHDHRDHEHEHHRQREREREHEHHRHEREHEHHGHEHEHQHMPNQTRGG
jgi:hypothetical protein